MDIRLFNTFLMVAELGNITQAAGRLNFSQPAVSAHIQSLEEHFGVLFFKRVGKKLFITPAGRAFIPYARNLIANYEKAREVLGEFQAAAPLRIGLASQTAIHLLSPILRDYQLKTDGMVSIDLCLYGELALKGLREGEYDLAVIVHEIPPGDEKFVHFPITTEKFIWAARKDLLKDAVQPIDIAAYPFIAHSADRGFYRQKYDHYLKKKKIHPVIEYNDSEAIKHAILDGLGIGVLNSSMVEHYIKKGVLVELTGMPKLDVTFSLAMLQKTVLSASLRTLLTLFNERIHNEALAEFLNKKS